MCPQLFTGHPYLSVTINQGAIYAISFHQNGF